MAAMGPKVLAVVIILIVIFFFLILWYFFMRSTGSSDFMYDGLKMLFTRNTSVG